MGFDIILHQLCHFFIASLVNRDGQNDQAFAAVILMDLFQRGPLPEAVRSPGGPEIQHNKLSLEFTPASFAAGYIQKAKFRGIMLFVKHNHAIFFQAVLFPTGKSRLPAV